MLAKYDVLSTYIKFLLIISSNVCLPSGARLISFIVLHLLFYRSIILNLIVLNQNQTSGMEETLKGPPLAMRSQPRPLRKDQLCDESGIPGNPGCAGEGGWKPRGARES
jgi:hypothetical protein